jgi:sugar (pentulose or hexulose) kinase
MPSWPRPWYSLYQPTPEISEFDPQAWIDAVRSVVAALRAEKRAALQAVRAIGL